MKEITQAPVPESGGLGSTYAVGSFNSNVNRSSDLQRQGRVRDVTTLSALDALLAAAASSCAVIFFTSRSCSPCKICYPTYDSLAAELGGKATLIKVDIGNAVEVASRYQVRATPTFVTFLQGDKFEEWQGADNAALEQKTRLLAQMAHAPHPHSTLALPRLQRRYDKPVLYSKVPPLEKLLGQLGGAAADPAIASLRGFVQRRYASEPPASVSVPDLRTVSQSLQTWIPQLAPNKLFALIDLLRIASVDPRVSAYFAEEEVSSSLFLKILEHITGDEEFPYSAHLTTVQTACNFFCSDLYPSKLLGNELLAEPLISLIAISLLDEKHVTLRVSAASLAFNVAAWNHRRRLEQLPDVLKEGLQIELAASLVEAISRENTPDALKGLILALGLLAYGSPPEGELRGVLTALDAGEMVGAKKLENEPGLVDEVKRVLL